MEVSLKELGLKRWMSRVGMYSRLLKAVPGYDWKLYRTGEEPEAMSHEEMVRVIDGNRRGWKVLEGGRRLVIVVSGFRYYEGREKGE